MIQTRSKEVKPVICGRLTRLRPKKPEDATDDYRWQTDPEFCRLNNKKPFSISFSEYLCEYEKVLEKPLPGKREFAIDTEDGLFIGNCACYDIDEKKGQAEVGITVGNRDYWGRGYGHDALNALVNHIFEVTEISRLYLKTLEDNKRAKRCFCKCGFNQYRRHFQEGKNFIWMERYRKNRPERQSKG